MKLMIKILGFHAIVHLAGLKKKVALSSNDTVLGYITSLNL